MVKHTASPGLNVPRLLLGAALAGIAAGVVLALKRQPSQEELLDEAEAAVEAALPGSASARASVDMMAPDPESLRGIPPYPGAVPRKITGSQPGGEVQAISWFSTDDSADKVLSFYEKAYTEQNLLHVSHRYNPKRGFVSWFEHRPGPDGGPSEFGDGILHMVAALDEGSQTVVLVSATEPQKILERTRPLPNGVRLPPGSRPQVLSMGEAGLERHTIFARYQLPQTELLEQVQDLMRDDGWHMDPPATAPDGRITLAGTRGNRYQMAVIEGGGASSQLLISNEERRFPRGAHP